MKHVGVGVKDAVDEHQPEGVVCFLQPVCVISGFYHRPQRSEHS